MRKDGGGHGCRTPHPRSRFRRRRPRPPPVRRARRTRGPLRLHGHVRARPSAGRRERLPRRRAGPHARAGRDARALPRRQLPVRLRLGRRRRPAASAAAPARPGVGVHREQPVRHQRVRRLVPGRGRGAHAGGQPRHARRRRRAAAGRVLQPRGGHRSSRICGTAMGMREPHGIRSWCLGNEMDAPWQIGQQDRRRVRPARARGGQADASRLARPAADGVRLLQPRPAELRRVGVRGAGRMLRGGGLPLRACVLRESARRHGGVPGATSTAWTRTSAKWRPSRMPWRRGGARGGA